VRLVWKKDDSGNARWVPPGQYQLRNYTIVKRKDDQTWTVSGSGGKPPMVEIRPGKTTILKIDNTIKAGCVAKIKDDAVAVGTCPAGNANAGVTVIKGEARAEFRGTLLDARGRELGSGSMSFG